MVWKLLGRSWAMPGHLLNEDTDKTKCISQPTEWNVDGHVHSFVRPPFSCDPLLHRRQDNSYPGQLVPKTTRTQDNSYPRQLIPMWYDMIWNEVIWYITPNHTISYITIRYHIMPNHIKYECLIMLTSQTSNREQFAIIEVLYSLKLLDIFPLLAVSVSIYLIVVNRELWRSVV